MDHPLISTAQFWTFSDPPTRKDIKSASIQTVLNVSQTGNFLDSPTPLLT